MDVGRIGKEYSLKSESGVNTMKKCHLFILVLFFGTMVFACAMAVDCGIGYLQDLADAPSLAGKWKALCTDDRSAMTAVANLPSHLMVIEEEAFENTSLVHVQLSDRIFIIGERAFSNIPSLRTVKLPERIQLIASDAFIGSEHVTLSGKPGSHSRTWAGENGIPPVQTAVCFVENQAVSASISRRPVESTGADVDDNNPTKAKKPIVRSADEIQNRVYQNSVAYHIQGRSPPAV